MNASTPVEVEDPVCGERFPPSMSTFQAEHGGKTYHFCCTHCQEAFEKEPGRYAGSA